MTEFYQSSKGPKRIADMESAYLVNARNKLANDIDDGTQPASRQAEVDAITAELKARRPQFVAQMQAILDDPDASAEAKDRAQRSLDQVAEQEAKGL